MNVIGCNCSSVGTSASVNRCVDSSVSGQNIALMGRPIFTRTLVASLRIPFLSSSIVSQGLVHFSSALCGDENGNVLPYAPGVPTGRSTSRKDEKPFLTRTNFGRVLEWMPVGNLGAGDDQFEHSTPARWVM